MNVVLKLIAILLLLANGIGALFGGWSLMTDPSGSENQLDFGYLDHTPIGKIKSKYRMLNIEVRNKEKRTSIFGL